MKYYLILAILLFISNSVFSQISFDQGYYINNQGEKIDGLIKDEGWRNNPLSFEFKRSETVEPKVLTIDEVAEFGIPNSTKFVRATVKIDVSTSSFDEISKQEAPEFTKEKIFLKLLIEGKASLYYYDNNNMVRYFYSIDGTPIEQLVYKKFLVNEFQVAENEEFKRQLWLNVRCNFDNKELIEGLSYKLKNLKNYFIFYNKCTETDFKDYSYNSTQTKLSIRVKPGIDYSDLNNVYHVDRSTVSFDSQINFRLGLDIEYSFPFAHNKWAIFLEPTYRTYNSSNESVDYGELEIEYTSVEVPLGLRYSMFIDDQSKIYADVSLVFDITLNGSFDYGIDVNAGESFAFGIGYEYERFLLQARYYTNRQLFRNYQYWNSQFNTIAFSLGYRIGK